MNARTRNAVLKFFRLYFPSTHVSFFSWERDHNSEFDVAITAPCSDEIVDPIEQTDPRMIDLYRRLTQAGFVGADYASRSMETNTETNKWECQLELSFRDEDVSKLTKDKGYPSLFNLDDYFSTVLRLLEEYNKPFLEQASSILLSERLTQREKLVRFTKMTYLHAASPFHLPTTTDFLKEFLRDLPDILTMKMLQFNNISGTPTKYIATTVAASVLKHFQDPTKSRYSTALFANMIGLFSELIDAKRVTDSTMIVLGFLLTERNSYPPKKSFPSNQSKESLYVNDLEKVITDCRKQLGLTLLKDQELMQTYARYMSPSRNIGKEM